MLICLYWNSLGAQAADLQEAVEMRQGQSEVKLREASQLPSAAEAARIVHKSNGKSVVLTMLRLLLELVLVTVTVVFFLREMFDNHT